MFQVSMHLFLFRLIWIIYCAAYGFTKWGIHFIFVLVVFSVSLDFVTNYDLLSSLIFGGFSCMIVIWNSYGFTTKNRMAFISHSFVCWEWSSSYI